MPKFKRHRFSAKNKADAVISFDADVHVDSVGDFYCYIPDYLAVPIKQFCENGTAGCAVVRGKTKVWSETFDCLVNVVWNALSAYLTPEKRVENVILYNIESHVSFAVTESGDIRPNGTYDGAKWPTGDDELYGGHHAAKPSEGGYSLVVGAGAFTKTTYIYGESKKVEYERYYGNGDHLSGVCPASVLNSWKCFILPKYPKEMPYTDEAATFFSDLMLAMAEISRKIQRLTGNQKDLMQLIESKQRLLPL